MVDMLPFTLTRDLRVKVIVKSEANYRYPIHDNVYANFPALIQRVIQHAKLHGTENVYHGSACRRLDWEN